MKALIRVILVLAVLFAFLLNHQIFSFEYGLVSFGEEKESTLWDEASFYTSVDEIAYYDMVGISKIVVFKSDTQPSRFYKISDEDLDAVLNTAELSNIIGNLLGHTIKINKVTVLPWFVYIMLLLVVLFIPLGRRKRR